MDLTQVIPFFNQLVTLGSVYLDPTTPVGILVITGIVIPMVFSLVSRIKRLAGSGK